MFEAVNDPVITAHDIKTFKEIIMNGMRLTGSKPALIRFIGDITADRGANDLFILFILEKLCKEDIPYTILESNHGMEFVLTTEPYKKPDAIIDFQRASLFSLKLLVKNKLISKEEVSRLINTVYKSQLLLLDYTLNEDATEIVIFSHAGIGLNTIEELAEDFDVNYEDNTINELALTINCINEKYRSFVMNKTLHKLDKKIDGISFYSAFQDVLWNRQYDQLERPAVHKGYSIAFVHGHDSNEETRENIVNLDNELGKQGRAESLYQVIANRKYEVFVSDNVHKIELQNTNNSSTKDPEKAIDDTFNVSDVELYQIKNDESIEKPWYERFSVFAAIAEIIHSVTKSDLLKKKP
jgi:hypothetical protein